MESEIKRVLAGGFALGIGLMSGYLLLSLSQDSIEIAALRKYNSGLQSALMRARTAIPVETAPQREEAATPPKPQIIIRERRVPEAVAVPDSKLRDEFDRLVRTAKSLEYDLEVAKAGGASAVEESRRWQTATRDLEERLNSSNRLADALQVQFKGASERISQLQLEVAAARRLNT